MKRLSFALALSAVLAACTTANPDVIQPGYSQRMSTVEDATVLSVRPVVLDGTQTGSGAVAGGVVGGIAGSSVGGWRDSGVAGVLGAVAGAVVGNAVERSATRENGVELLLQMKNGQRRDVIQARGEENLQPGDAVIVVSSGGRVRVMRAPAAVPAPPATAPTPVYTPH